jgi:protein gp37
MSNTKIEWAEETWNPVTGCTKISDGCKNCYAESIFKRFSEKWGYGFNEITYHPDRIDEPLSWQKPRRVFVCSMGDLFHEDVSFEVIAKVFKTMGYCWVKKKGHTFIVLTKRPERMKKFFSDWPMFENFPNVWLGVTAEKQEQANERIPVLLSIPAVKRFVSIEPMLGPVELDAIECEPSYFENALSLEEWTGAEDSPEVKASMGGGALLDLVICGGESGPGARPVHPDWVRGVRDSCLAFEVPFFFKQWGEWHPFCQIMANGKRNAYHLPGDKKWRNWGSDDLLMSHYRVGKKAAGRMLDGNEYMEWPDG